MKNTKARSFVAIIVVIAVSALILRIAIEQITKINITQNESNAQAALKFISAALENYAKDHLGAYPANFSALVQDNPPYLDKDYLIESPIRGYDYNCPRIETLGYSCSATPLKCNVTGRATYAVTTGGLVIAEECGKKE